MSKVYLCSFADTRLCLSALRFYQQAKAMQVFDYIFLYNETNLDKEFRDAMSNQACINGGGGVTRGFGYWCWKPQIILQTLQQMNEGDVLFYIDIGCEFQIEGRRRLQEMIDEIRKNEIMGVMVGGHHIEKVWTKASVFQHFGVLNDKHYVDTRQIASGLVMLCKTQRTQAIMQEWLNVFYHHFELVDDSPSPIPNDESFIENRHDQSIWSILNKKHNIVNFDGVDFTQMAVNPEQHPIVTVRNAIYCSFITSSTNSTANRYLKVMWIIPALISKLHPIRSGRRYARTLKKFLLHYSFVNKN
ncbi:MAG: hypothetical protein SPJ16_01930 [Helicobacter sp.]|uniref:hypothetical protein n=1 Tax=Helicobacter sp. TaxID=218 RepID=UPI002A919A66|nr:hypothetical protein [Helicobacter sp.]MDY5949950.1 hypothetical protein [Helicobacter sp.]